VVVGGGFQTKEDRMRQSEMTAQEKFDRFVVPQDWYFTVETRGYVKIHGDYFSARDEMAKMYRTKWCGQYSQSEWDAYVRQFGDQRDLMEEFRGES
jgi:hypothetical protein